MQSVSWGHICGRLTPLNKNLSPGCFSVAHRRWVSVTYPLRLKAKLNSKSVHQMLWKILFFLVSKMLNQALRLNLALIIVNFWLENNKPQITRKKMFISGEALLRMLFLWNQQAQKFPANRFYNSVAQPVRSVMLLKEVEFENPVFKASHVICLGVDQIISHSRWLFRRATGIHFETGKMLPSRV